jgi:hypothetical protein
MSRRLPAAAVAVAVAAGASGCGTTGLQLSSRSVSACYRAIPPAVAAAHDPRAHLVGVHKVAVSQVRKKLAALLAAHGASGEAVCAVALEGPFAAGQVDGAPVAQSGRYAVVLITSGGLHLVASVVTDRLPKSFKGRTF